MAKNSATGRDARKMSREWVERLVADAGGDDEALLRLCAEHLHLVEEHADAVRTLRDEAARRERGRGTPMVRIAKMAGVTDSALSRRILGAGDTRRVDRRQPGR